MQDAEAALEALVTRFQDRMQLLVDEFHVEANALAWQLASHALINGRDAPSAPKRIRTPRPAAPAVAESAPTDETKQVRYTRLVNSGEGKWRRRGRSTSYVCKGFDPTTGKVLMAKDVPGALSIQLAFGYLMSTWKHIP